LVCFFFAFFFAFFAHFAVKSLLTAKHAKGAKSNSMPVTVYTPELEIYQPKLICFKKSVIGSSGSDFELYRTVALWTTTFVAGAFFVNVNPHVNVATVESYADELFLLCFFWRTLLLRLRQRCLLRQQRGITGNIEHVRNVNIF